MSLAFLLFFFPAFLLPDWVLASWEFSWVSLLSWFLLCCLARAGSSAFCLCSSTSSRACLRAFVSRGSSLLRCLIDSLTCSRVRSCWAFFALSWMRASVISDFFWVWLSSSRMALCLLISLLDLRMSSSILMILSSSFSLVSCVLLMSVLMSLRRQFEICLRIFFSDSMNSSMKRLSLPATPSRTCVLSTTQLPIALPSKFLQCNRFPTQAQQKVCPQRNKIGLWAALSYRSAQIRHVRQLSSSYSMFPFRSLTSSYIV